MFQLKHALGVIAAIAGFILMLNILMLNINDIADVFVSNPIVFLILLAAAIVLIWFILKPLIEKIDEEERIAREKQEEERRRDEERKRREEAERRRQAEERERNTLRFKCPYCGKEYAEYPAGSKEILRICKYCRGHFYPAKDQTPRTPDEARMLAAEQRDAERIRSIEFHELHNAIERISRSPSNHGWSVEFNNYEAIYFNGSDWIHMEYPSRLETTAGQYMLALSCGSFFPSVLYHVSVEQAVISSRVRLWWCRRED